MKTKFLLLITVAILSSCGQPNKSKLDQIHGNQDVPSWAIVPKNNMHKYHTYNVFSLNINGKKMAIGFVLGKDSLHLITNAHVALGWVMLRRMDSSLALTGANKLNKLQVTKIVTIDKTLDFALLEFRWVDQPKSLQNMLISLDRLPDVGDSTYLLTHEVKSGLILRSSGDIIGNNYLDKRKPSFHYTADTLPGMSGSPLFNSIGELIGMHFGMPSESKFNRAIPIKLIAAKYPQFF